MLNPIRIRRKLIEKGVLGINARNRDFIYPSNPRRFYPVVDDKAVTKQVAIEAGVRVPELFATLEYQGHLHRLQEVADAHADFVIKPARGSGGGGILVFSGSNPFGLRKLSGQIMAWGDIRYHVSNIFGGMYSLGGVSDRVLVEQRLRTHSAFDPLSFRGVPDVRIIVYRGVPVMAMMRLPTSLSDGKANLHQGGVGAGVDLVTGVTTKGVCLNKPIEHHPDFGTPIKGFQAPGWPEVLEIASKLGHATGLGYVGVDLVIDETMGPTMLELNARPGISIQVANGEGLARRLKEVDELGDAVPKDPIERTALAKEIWKRTTY